ncbi:MAG: ZIP family metal transporter [Lachnospiraceae bacterium]|nr:ZIP family metal transporter [Lachnospiraceae bacterium]
MNVFVGIFIPFIGTLLGAACVFVMKHELKPFLQKTLLGFASGVMVAASVWSLLIPAIDMSENMGKLAFLPAAVGFALGIGFLLLMDELVPHIHLDSDKPEGLPAPLKKTTMLVLAVTLHNIPEGMAVGVVFAGLLSENSTITLAGAIALSVGIAIQNIPEGAIISLPLRSEGITRKKAFSYGMMSGIVEPIAAGITILLTGILQPILPYLLAFAAGAMIYVVVEELLPEASEGEHSNITTIGFAVGFLIMMILDVALG